MKQKITTNTAKSHFAIVSQRHAASGNPAAKLVPHDYREVVQSLIYMNAALTRMVERQEELDNTPTHGFLTSHNRQLTLLSQERGATLMMLSALYRFLNAELGWTSKDCETEWTILLNPVMLALSKDFAEQFEIEGN